ncbi:hypothetical protein ILYODFUR_010814 [Ilyodon furcidens]|uniref:Peptidase A9 domain-containing protein n=1 Tax=Ilyodon furcidens TaxID=33524 RepID=A0ABV0TWG3_9TELE
MYSSLWQDWSSVASVLRLKQKASKSTQKAECRHQAHRRLTRSSLNVCGKEKCKALQGEVLENTSTIRGAQTFQEQSIFHKLCRTVFGRSLEAGGQSFPSWSLLRFAS